MTTPAAEPTPERGSATRAEPSVLPDQTADDTDAGWAQAGRVAGPADWTAGPDDWTDQSDDDERFLRERPPHWE